MVSRKFDLSRRAGEVSLLFFRSVLALSFNQKIREAGSLRSELLSIEKILVNQVGIRDMH